MDYATRTGSAEVLARQWLAHLAGLNYPPSTIRAYTGDLALFGRFLERAGLEVAGVEVDHVEAWIGKLLKQELKVRTVQRKISTVRTWFKWLVRKRIVMTNPLANLDRMRGEERLPEFISEEQAERLIEAAGAIAGRTKAHLSRNRAILEVLYGSGCRAAELCALELGDILWDIPAIRFFGKGRKERIIPVVAPVVAALKAYLPDREAQLARLQRPLERSLFIGQRGRLNPDGLQDMLEQLARRAGMDHVHPHMMRHAYATHLHDRDADIRDIQALLGHKNIRTTMVYTRVSTMRMKRVIERAHPRA